MNKIFFTLLLLFTAIIANSQNLSDSTEYMGMRMTQAEADTLKVKLEQDSLPGLLSFISCGNALAFTSSLRPLMKKVDIPDGTEIYVIRKAEDDMYLCQSSARTFFMYRPDICIGRDEKMDSILNIPSEIYHKFRRTLATVTDLDEYSKKLGKAMAYYKKAKIMARKKRKLAKPIEVETFEILEERLKDCISFVP